MLRQSRRLFNRAERVRRLRRQRSHAALVAASLERLNYSCLSLKAFSAAIDEESVNLRVVILVELYKRMDHGVNPASGLNVVETADDDHKLRVEVSTKLLDILVLVADLHPRAPLHDRLRSDLCLVFVDVALPAVCWYELQTYLKRNCLLRLLRAIVSGSITVIFLIPESARSLRISQPSPPAPMTQTLMSSSVSTSTRSPSGSKLSAN